MCNFGPHTKPQSEKKVAMGKLSKKLLWTGDFWMGDTDIGSSSLHGASVQGAESRTEDYHKTWNDIMHVYMYQSQTETN